MTGRYLALALAILIALFPVVPAAGAPPTGLQPSILVYVNGQPVSFDVPPTIEGGRVLVPLRPVFEALGAAVHYDAPSRSITARRGESLIRLAVDSTAAIVNGAPVTLDVPARVIDGRTLVPVRFAGEALGEPVQWNENRTVAIGNSPAPPRNDELASRGSIPREDLLLLARLIYAEAGAEPYEGQVAVGEVVMNRTRSALFPNTIRGVIYEPWQFTSVGNEYFNGPPSQAALRAAQEAYNGSNLTNGALYFYNPARTTNQFLLGRKVTVTIGNHRFAR